MSEVKNCSVEDALLLIGSMRMELYQQGKKADDDKRKMLGVILQLKMGMIGPERIMVDQANLTVTILPQAVKEKGDVDGGGEKS